MKTTTLKLTRIALYSAIALVMHFIESLIPPLFVFAPNVKLGLANFVTLVVLFTDGALSGYAVIVIRCVLATLFAGNFTSLIYSLPSAILSYTVQVVLVKFLFGKIGLVTISVCGAVTFNTVQSLIAGLITQTNLTILIIYYLPAGFIAGVFVGVVAYFTLKSLPEKHFLT